jgi:hypothetical protein
MTTPDDHLKTLDGLARVFELAVKNGRRAPNTTNVATLKLCEERAAAIRWILAETAYGVDPSTLEGAA